MSKAKDGKSLGAPALTYIKQVGYARRLGRSVNKEANARATSWGTLTETHVFDLLPTDYQLVSTDRLFHPKYPFWSGAPDLIKTGNTTGDVKCPFSLELFCEKVDTMHNFEAYKKKYPEDYWQHVSNAILLTETGTPITHFEAIIFCPYKRELDTIRLLAMQAPPELLPQFKWLEYAYDKELPYLIEGKEFTNLNIAKFEVPQEDKDALTDAILRAEAMLKV